METLTVTETRQQLTQIIKEGKSIEIDHPSQKMILMPKSELEKLQTELLIAKAERIVASNAKKYTTAEVDAMLEGVLHG